MDRIGVRDLRQNVASLLRRARDGERIVVTVDGRPVAQLGPLEPRSAPTMDDLAAAGLVRLAHRDDKPPTPEPFGVPVDVRLDAVMAELRGEAGAGR